MIHAAQLKVELKATKKAERDAERKAKRREKAANSDTTGIRELKRQIEDSKARTHALTTSSPSIPVSAPSGSLSAEGAFVSAPRVFERAAEPSTFSTTSAPLCDFVQAPRPLHQAASDNVAMVPLGASVTDSKFSSDRFVKGLSVGLGVPFSVSMTQADKDLQRMTLQQAERGEQVSSWRTDLTPFYSKAETVPQVRKTAHAMVQEAINANVLADTYARRAATQSNQVELQRKAAFLRSEGTLHCDLALRLLQVCDDFEMSRVNMMSRSPGSELDTTYGLSNPSSTPFPVAVFRTVIKIVELARGESPTSKLEHVSRPHFLALRALATPLGSSGPLSMFDATMFKEQINELRIAGLVSSQGNNSGGGFGGGGKQQQQQQQQQQPSVPPVLTFQSPGASLDGRTRKSDSCLLCAGMHLAHLCKQAADAHGFTKPLTGPTSLRLNKAIWAKICDAWNTANPKAAPLQ